MKQKFSSLLTLLAVLALAVSAIIPTSVLAAPVAKTDKVSESPNGIYIVQMLDEPVVAYDGSIDGYAATAPAEGTKIDPLSANVVKYVNLLTSKHTNALKKTGGTKLYDYTYSFNGFAARMTLKQANKMAALNVVKVVNPDEIHDVDTSSTPTFLGLTETGGLWDQLGGTKNAGEGIIIGLIDSGIWPESLSFTDRVNAAGTPAAKGTLVFQQIPGWHGKCTPGENFVASMCNQKLIGAQYFNKSWGGNAGINAQRPWEFNSVRDYNGHGTHTASTSGGNYGVKVTGPAAAFGTISGMAPRARIAMYKALWSTADASTASGSTSDLVAAIDQAVADGVDVISYSISGSQTNFLDAAEVSFLYATRAGIFVTTSAGNSGPTVSTVAHPSPWITTVAAGTHNRSVSGSVTLGNGATYFGPSLAAVAVTAPLIDSTAAGLPGANATQVALCYSSLDGGNVLDPAKVAGKIVVCDRGVTARVNKSYAVMEAGGVGMILVNTGATQSLVADFHSVPSVHLHSADRAAVKAYAATPGATATINKAVFDYSTLAPYTASFSSRGPLIAGGGDLLKPDIIAPGQDILAAVSPASGGGLKFNLYSGTSMSTPHIAGIAALLKQAHPTWTPMMIKSAIMTSAYDVLDGGDATSPDVIFSQGAGHVKPNSAVDPGLVYTAGWNDWLAFLCNAQPGGVSAATCSTLSGMGYSLDPSDLNVASIAIGDMAGVQTVTRKVTNVGANPATYNASYTGMAGFNVAIAPLSLTLNPGETKSFNVTFTTTTAAMNAYTGGYLTWSDGTYNVRIPLVVKPVALAAPAAVFGTGDPISFDVTFGYTGSFTAAARGLIPSAITADTIADDPTDGACSLSTPNAKLIPVTIPADTTYARFSLFDADVNAGSDLDLCVYLGTVLKGSSGSGTSAEEVNLLNPAAGDYTVVVQGWGVAGTTPFKLHTWLLGLADAGNMSVSAPAAATIGATGTITLTFSGLTPATRYLGSIAYGGADGMPNPTIVRVDVP